MASGFFVTGTDTDVGKTWVSVAFMRALQAKGIVTSGMKPVAAGCEWQQGGWKNRDALLLQQYASKPFDYSMINPYAFEQAVSPHIACGDTEVDLNVITRGFYYLAERSECVVVEGAGGWLSPLGRHLDNAGLAEVLQLPVILVVGLRLGCINHARLTERAIRNASLNIAGCVAVQLSPDVPGTQDNLQYLQDSMQVPFLGTLPHLNRLECDLLSKFIDLKKLTNY